MPNYVSNAISISGKNASKFLEACSGPSPIYAEDGEQASLNGPIVDFTFNTIVPVPIEVLQAGYSETGYKWQIRNWGTKWDSLSESFDPILLNKGKKNEMVKFTVTTAWNPPTEWFNAAAAMFPDLVLEMYSLEEQELGIDYIKYVNGEVSVSHFIDRSDNTFKEIKLNVFGEEDYEDDWDEDEDEDEQDEYEEENDEAIDDCEIDENGFKIFISKSGLCQTRGPQDFTVAETRDGDEDLIIVPNSFKHMIGLAPIRFIVSTQKVEDVKKANKLVEEQKAQILEITGSEETLQLIKKELNFEHLGSKDIYVLPNDDGDMFILSFFEEKGNYYHLEAFLSAALLRKRDNEINMLAMLFFVFFEPLEH